MFSLCVVSGDRENSDYSRLVLPLLGLIRLAKSSKFAQSFHLLELQFARISGFTFAWKELSPIALLVTEDKYPQKIKPRNPHVCQGHFESPKMPDFNFQIKLKQPSVFSVQILVSENQQQHFVNIFN